jgi:hypothetical protein
MVEVDVNLKRNNQGEIDDDLKDIKELEARWKPTAAVTSNLLAGMPEYIYDGPIEDIGAKHEAIRERKRQKEEMKLRRKSKEET